MNVVHSPTARFSEVVERAGAPEQITLWHDPAKDPAFRKAIDQNRVMTIRQERIGTKKDFGIVGFKPGPPSAFLIFPKRLDQFADKRIVGIKYELLAGAEPKRANIRKGAID